MKEIWVTQRKGQAIEHVLLPLAEYDAACAIVEAARTYTEVRGIGAKRNVYRRLVEALGKEKLGNEQEYDDGPWGTTESDSCVDVTGYWHFPAPGVSGKGVACNPIIFGPARLETKPPIRVVPLKQGYLVVPNVFEGYAEDDMAFTDAFNLADWLLAWLGMGEAIIIDGPLHEMAETDRQKALDVAKAAQAYVEIRGGGSEEYRKLAEAVKKWRKVDGKDDPANSARSHRDPEWGM